MSIYQWPPAKGTESIFPRCVVFQRICNIAHHKPKVINVGLPKLGDDFDHQLNRLLAQLPQLECDGKQYKTSVQITDFFLNAATEKSIRARLTKLHSQSGVILRQWANESFINTLVYARWQREKNYVDFIRNVQWGESFKAIEPRVVRVRQSILTYLKRTTLANITEGEYHEMLQNQLFTLDQMISGQRFFEPMTTFPTVTDLNIFMVIQGLLSTDLEESLFIRKEFPNICRWFEDVDNLTSKSTD